MLDSLRTPLRWLTAPFRFAWWLITAPWRGLRRGWQAVHGFFTDVPEDVSLTDTIAGTLGSRDAFMELLAGFGEHLDALRIHLIRAAIALAITTAISAVWLTTPVMEHLVAPLGRLADLETIAPTEGVGVYMRVALLGGVTLAMPWLVLEVYLFIAPGLMPRSRGLLLLVIPAATLLFLAGVVFTDLIMLPAAIPFLESFGGFSSAWRPAEYFNLVTALMFWIGVAFQMPLAISMLAATGLIRARQLLAQWRIALVSIAVIAMLITPTTDPVNMALVMLPMIGLYGLSILGAAIAGRRPETK